MNTIVIGEPKICIVKGEVQRIIYCDGEFQEIYEKKNISEGKSPYIRKGDKELTSLLI
jgi:hypothetical protein